MVGRCLPLERKSPRHLKPNPSGCEDDDDSTLSDLVTVSTSRTPLFDWRVGEVPEANTGQFRVSPER